MPAQEIAADAKVAKPKTDKPKQVPTPPASNSFSVSKVCVEIVYGSHLVSPVFCSRN
jgi:hypothetical protein